MSVATKCQVCGNWHCRHADRLPICMDCYVKLPASICVVLFNEGKRVICKSGSDRTELDACGQMAVDMLKEMLGK